MTPREAWIVTLVLTIILMLMLALAGAVSELAAPTIQTEIGEAWSQAPR